MTDPMTNSAALSSSRRGRAWPQWMSHPVFISLLLVAAALAAFYSVVNCQFITYDDPDYVTENSHVKNGLTPEEIGWAFRTDHAGNWHPLTWLSHMVDVQLFGLKPAGHHLSSLLFHLANTVLLFLLLRRLTKASWRSALVAALFAVHPMHVESVAWISERKDVLSSFFFLLTLLAYARYAEARKVGTQRASPLCAAYYAIALFFFALGLMSKPMLVTLPCILLLIDFWPLQRLCRGQIIAFTIEKIPFFALSLASCFVTMIVQTDARQSLAILPLEARLANTVISYARYLTRLLWPFDLATPYPHPGRWPAAEIALACLLLTVISASALWSLRRFPFIFVGWFWFLGMMVPVIGLVQVGEQSMADRYTYLPFIGLFIALAWGSGEIIIRRHISPPLVGLLGLLLVALCVFRTRDQINYWQSSENLYRHAIKVSEDNFIAYYNLGSVLDSEGRINEAMTNYLTALKIQPRYQDPLNNIGCILASRKQYAEAIPYFEAALRSKSDFTDVHANLASAFRALGKQDEAILHYRAVLEKKPVDIGALNGLGDTLTAQGRFTEAIPFYESSLRLKPQQATVTFSLASTLMKLRRMDEAIPQYRLAFQQSPTNALAAHDLGIALAMRGNPTEAISQLKTALRLEPNNATFAISLGKVLGSQGDFSQALPYFTEAVRVAPENPDAHNSLGSTLAALGRLDEAIGEFTVSLQLRPEYPATLLNLGRAFAAQGNTHLAREQYNKVLRLKPGFPPAVKELNALNTR